MEKNLKICDKPNRKFGFRARHSLSSLKYKVRDKIRNGEPGFEATVDLGSTQEAYITSSPAKSYVSFIVTVLGVWGFRAVPPVCERGYSNMLLSYVTQPNTWYRTQAVLVCPDDRSSLVCVHTSTNTLISTLVPAGRIHTL